MTLNSLQCHFDAYSCKLPTSLHKYRPYFTYDLVKLILGKHTVLVLFPSTWISLQPSHSLDQFNSVQTTKYIMVETLWYILLIDGMNYYIPNRLCLFFYCFTITYLLKSPVLPMTNYLPSALFFPTLADLFWPFVAARLSYSKKHYMIITWSTISLNWFFSSSNTQQHEYLFRCWL